MGFKLVRMDSQDPCKIPLQVGTHLIGRGKFLDCDDKRVSRNHGELVVSDDSVTIKALHRNPLFYIKKAKQAETEILTQSCTLELYNGDKFGLLPDIYWYEVIYCINKEPYNDIQPVKSQQDNNMDTTIKDEGSEASPSLLNEEQHTTEEFHNQSPHQSPTTPLAIRSDSQSTIPADQQNEELQEAEVEKCPIKRHNDENNSGDEAKKIKVEPIDDQCETNNVQNEPKDGQAEPSDIKNEPSNVQNDPNDAEVKDEPIDIQNNDVQNDSTDDMTEPNDVQAGPNDTQAGPSCKQANESSTANDKAGSPASPVKPPPAPRERCLYGANCYRKNPQHKAQFSHPADSDWGAGAQGVCPWGARCQRRDPRHWTQHQHPPGTAPPPPRPAGDHPQGKRRKQKKKRDSSDEDTPADDLILTGKRARKTIPRPDYSDSDSDSDPYKTDGSDDWQPSGNTDSQIYSQDDY